MTINEQNLSESDEQNLADNTKTIIGFIGLGNMGAPMAENLLKAGYAVQVYDLSDEAMQRLQRAGANLTSSPTMAATGAQVIISMLPAGKQVRAIYLGEDEQTKTGLLAQLPKGTLVIDCSTIAAVDARDVAKTATELGINFLDAPVSGGTGGAIAGSLTFIVGGQAEVLAQAQPILAAMGQNIFHAGEQGAGQVAKICNNLLLGILMAGTAEAINLGVKNGLDPKVLSEIMLQSSGRNWALEVYNPYPKVLPNVPASHNYEGGFMSKLMQKDLNLALQTAQGVNAKTPMGLQAIELYSEHNIRFSDKDFSSIMGHYDLSILTHKPMNDD